ncbi:hypothetical protein EV182_006477 [Spiromyces aspiralis]|uniref:Uncharacterized protein n=1 Tax=Spiromyces aspiralis TaxID=68401 RepID=A0ACC1HQ87_9FUNG|nr:hypothetical protein EV182_006477 [Spiromyces aspiralis]
MEPLDSEYIKLESHSKQMYETGVSLRLNSHRLMCELEAADREVAHWEAQLELASEQLQQVENAIKDGVVNYISNNVDDIDTLVRLELFKTFQA